jgi:YggT family protein
MFLITTILIYAIYAFMIVLLVRVAFSWVSPFPTNPVSRLAFRVTEPVLAPLRRWIPPISGLDLTPLILWFAAIFIIAALRSLSQ